MSEYTPVADAIPQKPKYPKSVPYIIGNEAAERFSFYGMRSILVTFLVAQFYNPTGSKLLESGAEAHANASTHFFVMLAYALPFVGGIVADWFTGKYKIILYISLVYCLGHLFLAMFDTNLTGFTAGLVLVAIGAGGIKSCVSANVGDQFDATNQSLLSKVYGWFYFSINAGSVLSTIIIPEVYDKYGAKWAFGIPGILMGLATIIFFSGRKLYIRVPPSGVNKDNFVFITFSALTYPGKIFSFKGTLGQSKYIANFFVALVLDIAYAFLVNNHYLDSIIAIIILIPLLWYNLALGAKRCHDIGLNGWYQLIPFFYIYLLFARSKENNNSYVDKLQIDNKSQTGQSWLDVAKEAHNPERVDGVKAVYRVMAVFFFAFAFWAVWDQNLSEWVIQAGKMDRTIGLGSFSLTMLPGQVQTFNPIFLLLFIPLFNYWVYPYFDSIGIKTTPLRRLGAGLVLTALSFVIIALIQSNIDHGGTPSIWWQIFAYVILSAAEVLVSITGLEYAYTHAPKSMKSTMTAIWLLVVSLGNLFTAAINTNIANKGVLEPYLSNTTNYYWFFVGVVSLFTVAFMFVSPRLKEHNYITNPYVDDQAKSKMIADTDNL